MCTLSPVAPASRMFACLGQLDALRMQISACRSAAGDAQVGEVSVPALLRDAEDQLLLIQAELAGAPRSVPLTTVEHLGIATGRIEHMPISTGPVRMPGANERAAQFDIACASARNAALSLDRLHESGERAISASSRAYLTKLSALLRALGRLASA